LYRLELTEEQPVRVDPDDHVGASAQHAPLVIAITAANVQYPLALEVQVRRNASPFPVRAPFGIDVHAKQIEGAFAPGRQPHQCLAHLHAAGIIAVAVQTQSVYQVDFARLQGR